MSHMSKLDIDEQNKDPERCFKGPTLTNHGKILVLKELRKKNKWSQERASKVFGYTSYCSWRDYESGRTKVPGQLLRSIEHYVALHKLIYANNNS